MLKKLLLIPILLVCASPAFACWECSQRTRVQTCTSVGYAGYCICIQGQNYCQLEDANCNNNGCYGAPNVVKLDQTLNRLEEGHPVTIYASQNCSATALLAARK